LAQKQAKHVFILFQEVFQLHQKKGAMILRTMPVFNDDQQNKKIDDLHRSEEEDLVQELAETKYNIPYINLKNIIIDNSALEIVPEKMARDNEVAPFAVIGNKIDIAVRSPERVGTKEVIAYLESKKYIPSMYMASVRSIEKVWGRYHELSMSAYSARGSLEVESASVEELEKTIHSIKEVKEHITSLLENDDRQSTSKILEAILGSAIALHSSDIHIEPEEDYIRLRFRLDGILEDVAHLPYKLWKLITSRIKLLSGMKLTIENKAQDGRYSIKVSDDEINIRTSTVPSAYGEGIVMRLLDPRSIRVKAEDLGFPAPLYKIIEREINKPNGMILLTGPTGSGKTTSLYSFLKLIYSPEKKMITIEDPIEYHLPGITQTQTDNEKDYTFISGLRAALRQDPDVIMVGEIRDPETAEIAVNAALTGHIVFSTLHTNNAAGVIPRLINLKVNPKTIPSALSLAIAQRLVRKLVKADSEEIKPTAEEHEIIVNVLKRAESDGKDFSVYNIDTKKIYANDYMIAKPKKGMAGSQGYKGRIGIFEAIQTDEAIEAIIPNNPSERELRKIAAKQGLLTMQEDGVVKVLQHVTSLAEVMNVVDLYEE
jgi:type IV pilus assembly protein PilB